MDSELEKRIQQHIEGCDRMIRPSNNPIINQRMQEKRAIFRTAPRDVPSVERAIRIKKRQLKEARIINQTDKLVNELDVLEWVAGVMRGRNKEFEQTQNPG